MFSMLCDVESSFKYFLIDISSALGFVGLLAIVLAVEAFFVGLFVLRTAYSYEMRLGRSLNKLNMWLYKNKKIDQSNIKEFNDLIKKGPKRLVYNWQQYILFREHEPSYYLSLDNLVEKPLRTSGWSNNIKNLNLVTFIWAGFSFLFGVAFEATIISTITFTAFAVAVALPVFVITMGIIASILLRGKKISNLDEIYHNYHIFARFITNACVDLPNFIDYDLLFTSKELEKASPQLREYYEKRARQAKKEFEEAKKNDIQYVEYDFDEAGVDGSLVLERAMRETEAFINKKTSILAKITQVETEKEALRRNYENVQKDLQRKLQACKENIAKLIENQEATTNRMEVGFLRKQQEQEISKQESLQTEYDQEETRFALSSEELDQEIVGLRKQLEDSKNAVQKAMVAEYQSFYEKVMKSAYYQADKKVQQEKAELKREKDINEKELTIVQTQVKRLADENDTLRARLGDNFETVSNQNVGTQDGHYDENGNYIYSDGSFHDVNGLFHDVDGNVYDMNGTLVVNSKEEQGKENETIFDDKTSFGSVIDVNASEKNEKANEESKPRKSVKTDKEPASQTSKDLTWEPYNPEEEEVASAKVVEKEDKGDKVEDKAKVNEDKEKTVPKSIKAESKGKRGRPRKDPSEVQVKERRPVGRPKKPVSKIEPKEKKPVGRPKKTDTKSTKAPDKDKLLSDQKIAQETLDNIERINELISQEESKLKKMKILIGSEINEAMSASRSASIDKQRDKIMKEIEDLQAQAGAVEKEADSKDLSAINKRLEDLIKAISEINNK